MTLYSTRIFESRADALIFVALLREIRGTQILTSDGIPYHVRTDGRFLVVRKWSNHLLTQETAPSDDDVRQEKNGARQIFLDKPTPKARKTDP